MIINKQHIFFEGSEASDVILNVEGCTDPPCEIVRGETYSADITFTSGN
mgnify:CR=1 FL=1